MANEDPKFCCRVCGLFQGEDHPPWGEDGKCPSFDICECCGAEFGYDDCFFDDVKRTREEWLKDGAKWHWPKDKPENWSLEEQMKNIPEEFK
jgi:hypothetical protein